MNEVVVKNRGSAASFLDVSVQDCIDATVAWAKVLMIHRAFHCAGTCAAGAASDRAFLWDYTRRYEVKNDWYTAGMNLALTYDVLYSRMRIQQRRVIRSALALLVLKKSSWGNTITSDSRSPNALLHPHRIFSNWALYHSNLYITNLAIEGETDFDSYTTAVLAAEGEDGFNAGLNTRFEAMIDAYMKHSIYPDGSTFEDGYTYFFALREGSLGLVAAHRRGLNVLDTNRFRGLIHNVAQMNEPWHCGRIMGHASGGGTGYAAYAALFRYVYPNGALPNMIWRQRMGNDFKNGNPCRIDWFQYLTQIAFMGDEHGTVTDAESPQGLQPAFAQQFPLSYYAPRRGLLIARASMDEEAAYLHFDARPDSFYPGHDNADRGGFTLAALRTSWLDDFAWRDNPDSRKHSLMHVDGLAQDEKAPCVKMLKTDDDGAVVLAAADLTYAYNVQWTRNWPDENPPTKKVNVYINGVVTAVSTLFTTPEMGDPRDFGWPEDDDGADLGMTRASSNLFGDPDAGFAGMWTWKRAYRETELSWGVRSAVLVRAEGTVGYVLITDSFKVSRGSNHVFDSYLILSDGVSVEESSSSCNGGSCKIVLTKNGAAQMDVHVLAKGSDLKYKTEEFISDARHMRLIISSKGRQDEEFWLGFHAHIASPEEFEMSRTASTIEVVYGRERRFFTVDSVTHAVVQSDDEEQDTNGNEEPMTAVELREGRGVKLESLERNQDRFLHIESETSHQAVVKITSRGSTRRRRFLDMIKTCFRYTREATTIAVYDCGATAVADGNYTDRKCTLVAESGTQEFCGSSEKSDFKVDLDGGRPYFVAISVEATGGKDARLQVLHTLVRV